VVKTKPSFLLVIFSSEYLLIAGKANNHKNNAGLLVYGFVKIHLGYVQANSASK
jgi:hypothetical protein